MNTHLYVQSGAKEITKGVPAHTEKIGSKQVNNHLYVQLDPKKSDEDIRCDMERMTSAVKAIATEGNIINRNIAFLGVVSAVSQTASAALSSEEIGRTLSVAIGGISALGISGLFVIDHMRRSYTFKALDDYRASIERFLEARSNPGEK